MVCILMWKKHVLVVYLHALAAQWTAWEGYKLANKHYGWVGEVSLSSCVLIMTLYIFFLSFLFFGTSVVLLMNNKWRNICFFL